MTALDAATPDTRERPPYQWLTRYPKSVDWHRKLTPGPLYELLDAAVAKYASRPCTNFLGKVLTYREIGRMVDRAATGLQQLGVKKGTKVGLFMPNCPTFIVYYFALPVLVGYAPKFMDTPVIGPVNIAYLFALSQFVMAWILAYLYVRQAVHFDRMARDIIARLRDIRGRK